MPPEGARTSYKMLRRSGLCTALVLMCRTEEVENDLHRVECLKRNLHEEGVPLAHGTVPQTRKLESLEFAALIAL